MPEEIYSVIVPVYDSVESLAILAEEIDGVFSKIPDADYELVFVDDKSPDPRTWPALEKLDKEGNKVKAVRLTRNFGQQAATLCGMAEARGDFVITMDDDLQHAPNRFGRLPRGNRIHDATLRLLAVAPSAAGPAPRRLTVAIAAPPSTPGVKRRC